MKLVRNLFIFGVFFLLVTSIEARRKHHKQHKSSGSESKTKTNWSTSISNGDSNTMVATEEHAYYVKRTFAPLDSSKGKTPTLPNPPYLAIPIAWFSFDDCATRNSVAINGNANALQEGYLCDDDCTQQYEPICGRTQHEVAVFYNKCKLNVAKCRTHGLWTDLDYGECKNRYPKEVEYTDKKFRSSPYFRHTSTATNHKKDTPDDTLLETVLEDVNEIRDQLDEAEIETEIPSEGSGSSTESTTSLTKI